MAEADLFEIRLEKLRRLEAESGIDAYPARYPVDSTLSGIRARFDDLTAEDLGERAPRVRVAGRLAAVREHGKSAFGDLDDGSGRIQCHARTQVLGDRVFRAWLDLDIGDFVGVEGELFRTRTDELTVKVDSFALLGKALRPPPEKWHGLKDTELRYRRRYLDLLSNPDTRELFRTRAAILRAFRAHLDANGFVEVETPLLQPLYGGATARPFTTHHNSLDMDLYLRIAPELYLKRLLVGGLQRVYDLNRNFRNEGLSRHHNPEFTMLELYAAYWDYERMMDFAEELLCVAFGDPAGEGSLRYGGAEIPLRRPWRRVSFETALTEIGDLAPELLDDPEALRSELTSRDVQVEGLGLGGLKGAALDHFVEHRITAPAFIVDYPRAISPFSKADPEDADRVERFELFMGGIEVANGYSELNDPREQRRRMQEHVDARGDDDEVPPVVDEDYVRALEYGMPPAAGIGIGVDRIVMLATDSPSIRDVVLFPLMRTKG